MYFHRLVINELETWKTAINRKPLVLRGARQVGKTTLVKKFAKQYRHSIFLNLERPKDVTIFERYDNVKTITEVLFLSNNISITEVENTLLFIDEVQEYPKTIQLLRYFYEEVPKLHVIVAGSLMDFAIKKIKNFPVGRIQNLYLYPLNFQEYLTAIGHSRAKEELVNIPLRSVAHNTLLDLFHRYAIIGGMPEVIKTDIQSNSLTELPKVYDSIWGTYKYDVEKYSSSENERRVIKHIMNTAHLSVDRRIKFHNFGNSNYRSREVSQALNNLSIAKIIQLIYPTTSLEPPIIPDIRKSPRLQFLDTGIVNHILDIQANMLAMKDLSKAFKGAIIPHLITQELISINSSTDNKPNFWVREKKQSSAEVDLVYTYANKVIPIEVKSSAKGSLKSLHQFVNRSNHPYAIRLYMGEFSVEIQRTKEGTRFLLMNLPYFLGTQLPKYINYFVNNYSL